MAMLLLLIGNNMESSKINKFYAASLLASLPLFVCAAGSDAPSAAGSQIFLCKDATGRTITSDRPIAECADRSTKVLGKDGTVRREIPPPLTAEQKIARKQAEEKRKADEIAAQEQKQKDNVLLSIYRSEKEIEAARERTVGQLRSDIIEANNAADAAERKRRLASAEIDKIKAKKARPPVDLLRQMEEAEQSANAERKRADKLEVDLAAQKSKYDTIMARFRDLMKIDGSAKRH